MILQTALVFVLLNALNDPVQSFMVSRPSQVSTPALQPFDTVATTSTCLYAEDGEEGEAATEEAPEEPAAEASSSSETDILNSPPFLKRKVDVLKSDIAKIEQDIEESKQLVEAGKAEWGPQLDALALEVSRKMYRMEMLSS